jgi:selenide,water dikinase
MTDVTGFGLIGHLLEMTGNEALSSTINYLQVPLMEDVKQFAAQFIYPDNAMRNWKAFNERVSGVEGESLITLCDPQTNGGLLIAVDPANWEEVHALFEKEGQFHRIIGSLNEFSDKQIIISQ